MVCRSISDYCRRMRDCGDPAVGAAGQPGRGDHPRADNRGCGCPGGCHGHHADFFGAFVAAAVPVRNLDAKQPAAVAAHDFSRIVRPDHRAAVGLCSRYSALRCIVRVCSKPCCRTVAAGRGAGCCARQPRNCKTCCGSLPCSAARLSGCCPVDHTQPGRDLPDSIRRRRRRAARGTADHGSRCNFGFKRDNQPRQPIPDRNHTDGDRDQPYADTAALSARLYGRGLRRWRVDTGRFRDA